ncbi:MAG TPA: single-stranded DNA-binding protein [Rhodothermales bacterium]|nr:single-stranded DNA-binding protein [Rhodothermales bacterium]HRR08841.1 single-stranded DNA-binding protein [Rhodothermales bacterium]
MAHNTINRVTLIGFLAADPQVRATGSGITITNFVIMTNESYRDGNGQTVERSESHRLVAFDKLADICAKYLTKGRKVYIEGSLQTRSYEDKDGNKRYLTEIRVHEMMMLDRSPEATSPHTGQQNGNGQQTATKRYTNGRTANRVVAEPVVEEILEATADLPF